MSNNYTKLDEKIDKYLGTNNLRPGPVKRAINKKIMGDKTVNKKVEDKKMKINFCSSSVYITRNIKWEE
jgi:hypothetical protein